MCTTHVDPAPLPQPPLLAMQDWGDLLSLNPGLAPNPGHSQQTGEGQLLGSGLGALQQPQQGLGDSQEVDHLSNAKQWGDDQGTTVGTLQESRRTLVLPDLPVGEGGSELVPSPHPSPHPWGLAHLAQSRNPE